MPLNANDRVIAPFNDILLLRADYQPNEELPISSTTKPVSGQCFSLKSMQRRVGVGDLT